MLKFLRQIGQTIRAGFSDGVASNLDRDYDPQERKHQELLSRVADPLWTDDQVWQELMSYCRTYDRKVRLARTNAVLGTIMDHRPAIREHLRERHR